ncbi:hypothetical protein EV122DRAFT_252039 [Schizophyllum commune]
MQPHLRVLHAPILLPRLVLFCAIFVRVQMPSGGNKGRQTWRPRVADADDEAGMAASGERDALCHVTNAFIWSAFGTEDNKIVIHRSSIWPQIEQRSLPACRPSEWAPLVLMHEWNLFNPLRMEEENDMRNSLGWASSLYRSNSAHDADARRPTTIVAMRAKAFDRRRRTRYGLFERSEAHVASGYALGLRGTGRMRASARTDKRKPALQTSFTCYYEPEGARGMVSATTTRARARPRPRDMLTKRARRAGRRRRAHQLRARGGKRARRSERPERGYFHRWPDEEDLETRKYVGRLARDRRFDGGPPQQLESISFACHRPCARTASHIRAMDRLRVSHSRLPRVHRPRHRYCYCAVNLGQLIPRLRKVSPVGASCAAPPGYLELNGMLHGGSEFAAPALAAVEYVTPLLVSTVSHPSLMTDSVDFAGIER